MVLALFFPSFSYPDGREERLADNEWAQVWVFVVAGLAGYAALSVLGEGRARGTGIVLLLALAPLMLEVQPAMFGRLADGDGVRIGLGFVLLVGAVQCSPWWGSWPLAVHASTSASR